MSGRSTVAVALLLALGLAVGYGGALALSGDPEATGTAEPVAASPRLPVPGAVATVEDPDDEALRPGVPLVEQRMDGGRFDIVYPVPEGWRANRRAADETKWKLPGTSNNTYVLRVAQVTSRQETVQDLLEERVASLDADQDGFVPLERGPGSLEYTYLSDEGTFRHSFIRWLDLDGNDVADVEIVVHGREGDVPGTRDLVRRIADGTRAE